MGLPDQPAVEENAPPIPSVQLLRDLLTNEGFADEPTSAAETVCAVRSLLRHRDGLVRAAATCVHRLHKALTQMNIQLQHVIADVTGVTGLAILEAILKGERDPVALAKLKDGRIRASTDTLAKSLHGDWRAEHLFTLRQGLDTWKHFQAQITACDEEIARLLQAFAAKVDVTMHPLPPRTSTHTTPRKNEPRFEARAELYRTCGVDLTQVPGLQSGTALVLVGELGPDFAERFPTAKNGAVRANLQELRPRQHSLSCAGGGGTGGAV